MSDTKLQQLYGPSQNTVWIGWAIIGAMWSVTVLFGWGWVQSVQRDLLTVQNESRQLAITQVADRGRLDATAVSLQTMVGVMTRIEDFMRQIELRITRMEVTTQNGKAGK